MPNKTKRTKWIRALGFLMPPYAVAPAYAEIRSNIGTVGKQCVKFRHFRACHQLAEKTPQRHSRAGGNPSRSTRSLDKTWFAKHREVDSRLRGNDGFLYCTEFSV
ncbi:hypothetical protein [Conchiformibius kuhniae]|uniref:Secreted protein n=1 Tax=Conchiformibius kuhniae TaxID=211502 RepID=A0A8T9MRP0_9NEIS|nr:hypothetical protein [Conchiformibius kuhniae]UOP04570.1 hypothetical protein LVJ77_09995 [Conchiformibius kuhniae]